VTDWDRLGGEEVMRPLVASIVRRMAQDFIIGFRFAGKDLDRIAHFELELASSHLGGPWTYTGRSLQQVHEPLRISRGQFQRRLAVLGLVLRDAGVPDDIAERWLAHDQALEPLIADTTDCGPPT
jgi:truncated hemoglobin YjbI